MKLRVGDLTAVLAILDLPEELRTRLQNANVSLSLTDQDITTLNDACLVKLQEEGFSEDGSPTEVGRRLEQIVDALNAD